MSYADSLLADGEHVIYRTKQHVLAPILNARYAVALLVLAAFLFIVGSGIDKSWVVLGALKPVVGWLTLVVLLVGILWLLFVYLRWATEDYVVTDRRVLKVEGMVNKHSADSSLDKINDAVIDQSFLGRIFGYGDLTILTAAEEAVDRYTLLSHALLFKKTMLNAKHDLEEGTRRPGPPLRAAAAAPAYAGQPAYAPQPGYAPPAGVPNGGARRLTPDEVTQTLARLADLRDRGAITPDEYETKKAELLAQL